MEEYKSNAYRSKEPAKTPDKKIEKVVTGAVRTKKKSEARKLADIFISEDISNVKNYIFMDVLIPAIKKAIDDIVSNGIHMILYNGDKRSEKRSSVSRVSYSGYYNKGSNERELRAERARNGFDFDEILFTNRGDAESVLSAMEDIIDRYDTVSVLDFYDLADVSTTNYAAQRYGWNDIHTARVVRVSDGYIIQLPRPIPLN